MSSRQGVSGRPHNVYFCFQTTPLLRDQVRSFTFWTQTLTQCTQCPNLSHNNIVTGKAPTLRFLLLSSTVRAPVTAADHLPELLTVFPLCGAEWLPLSPVFSPFFLVAVLCSFFCSLITASFSAACVKQMKGVHQCNIQAFQTIIKIIMKYL